MKQLKAFALIAFILALAPALAMSQAKQKETNKLPAAFNQARYVYVQAMDGQEFDPRLIPEDREAIATVMKALNDWNRYVLTLSCEQADLIFVVRKGRLSTTDAIGQRGAGPLGVPGRPTGAQAPGATGAIPGEPGCGGPGSSGGLGGCSCGGPAAGGPAYGGPGPGAPGAGGPASGGSVGEEVGPADDLLEVYQPTPDHERGTLLWEHTRANGLDEPGLTLFKDLKDQVERAYPLQTASQKP